MLKTINSKFHTPMWLSIVLIAILILRIPSLFMPYSYGDEMIYLTLGQGIKQGIPLYSGIYDNKPPLLYLVAAIAGNMFMFKSILLAWNMITIYLFWRLTETILPKKEKLQKASVWIFALLTTLPLLEGNIANAEMFMLLPTISAFLILLKFKETKINLISAGILFSLAALFKMPAAFEIPVIVFYWLITGDETSKNIKSTIFKSFFLGLGFVIPIGISFVYFWIRGSLSDYLAAAFLQNIGYLSSWRPDSVKLTFLQRNAPLLTRSIIVLAGSFLLFWKRRKIDKVFIFVSLWLIFALFAVTLSERPYPHYLIQAVPAVSLLFAFVILSKDNLQFMSLLPLALAFFVPLYFKYWHYPIIPYYERFVKLATGSISSQSYLSSFASEVPRNYQIAEFISKHTSLEDKIFVWGDDAKIYALSRRLPPIKYVADYHITDHNSQESVISQLLASPTELIVVLPESKAFPELDKILQNNYLEIANFDNAAVWKLIKAE